MNRRSEYRDEFLNSHFWKQLRSTIITPETICIRCASAKARDLHHVVYRNDLYAVMVGDLLPLCRRCHTKVHTGIRLGLIGTPSHPNTISNLSSAIKRTISISDSAISAEQSRKQTKKRLRRKVVHAILNTNMQARKRCFGALKCHESELNTGEFSGYRIDKVKYILKHAERHIRPDYKPKKKKKGVTSVSGYLKDRP